MKKSLRIAALAVLAAIAGLATYVVLIFAYLGTVPTPQPGWIAGPEVARKPSGGEWLGFKVGQRRVAALANACELIATRRLEPVDFKCLADTSEPVGLIGDKPGSSETWTFRPRLWFWERHCFGIQSEELNVFVKNSRVDGLTVDCGVIDF
jgi:hypothetical protein